MVNLEKAFDTVDNQIILAKLDHYGIHGIPNDFFNLYLSNCNQFVSINGYGSGLTHNVMNCEVPQGSVQRQLLFLWFVNDLNQAM